MEILATLTSAVPSIVILLIIVALASFILSEISGRAGGTFEYIFMISAILILILVLFNLVTGAVLGIIQSCTSI